MIWLLEMIARTDTHSAAPFMPGPDKEVTRIDQSASTPQTPRWKKDVLGIVQEFRFSCGVRVS